MKCYFGQVVYDVKKAGKEWLMRFQLGKDLNALSEVCTVGNLIVIFFITLLVC